MYCVEARTNKPIPSPTKHQNENTPPPQPTTPPQGKRRRLAPSPLFLVEVLRVRAGAEAPPPCEYKNTPAARHPAEPGQFNRDSGRPHSTSNLQERRFSCSYSTQGQDFSPIQSLLPVFFLYHVIAYCFIYFLSGSHPHQTK